MHEILVDTVEHPSERDRDDEWPMGEAKQRSEHQRRDQCKERVLDEDAHGSHYSFMASWSLRFTAQPLLNGRPSLCLEPFLLGGEIDGRAALSARDGFVRARLGRGSLELRAATLRTLESELDSAHVHAAR
jgi:hypothetical protein